MPDNTGGNGLKLPISKEEAIVRTRDAGIFLAAVMALMGLLWLVSMPLDWLGAGLLTSFNALFSNVWLPAVLLLVTSGVTTAIAQKRLALAAGPIVLAAMLLLGLLGWSFIGIAQAFAIAGSYLFTAWGTGIIFALVAFVAAWFLSPTVKPLAVNLWEQGNARFKEWQAKRALEKTATAPLENATDPVLAASATPAASPVQDANAAK